MNKSLKAFTLAEVTIALLISGIVSTMALGVYQQVNRQTNDWWSFQDSCYDFEKAVQVLRNDVNRADFITMRNEQVLLTSDNRQIAYDVQGKLLRHLQGYATDTIWSACELQRVSFDAQTNLVDTLQLSVSFMGETMPLQLVKRYSFQQLLMSQHADSTNTY